MGVQPHDGIGGRILALRRAAHMSQAELARRLGITAKHCSEVERGISHLSLEKLSAAAELFDCSIDYLVHGADLHRDMPWIPMELVEIMDSGDGHEKAVLRRYLKMYKEIREIGKGNAGC